MKLSRFNRIFWPFLLPPLSILLYWPINRYIFLPLFGNGEPYIDSAGNDVERYFSANQCALIAAVCIAALTMFFIMRTTRQIQKRGIRIAVRIFACFWALVGIILFLEFSLWS